MGRFRKDNVDVIHKYLSCSATQWNSKDSYGIYGLLHGVYHLVVLGKQKISGCCLPMNVAIMNIFYKPKNVKNVLQTHLLAVSHFVQRNGLTKQDDVRLSYLLVHSLTLQEKSHHWLKQTFEEYCQEI